ncbi:MAG TPA: hypothetical protein VMS17_23815 [Gemmataceae bacterium]|nr:hypothetical protein [Gemmataceae bacterium]
MTEPIYIIVYIELFLTALVLFIDRAAPRRPHRLSTGRGDSGTDLSPASGLEQVQRAVESLTGKERRFLRRWMDERRGPDAEWFEHAMRPCPSARDERTMLAPAPRSRPL